MSGFREERRPWLLMTADAALSARDRLAKLNQSFDVVIVPAEYFQQAVDLLDQPTTEDVKQSEAIRVAGLSIHDK